MNRIIFYLPLFFLLCCPIHSHGQSIEDRDLKEIKSKSRLIVKNFEELLNYISNNQTYEFEVKEIVANSLDPENVNKLFKSPKIVVEDDINPNLINQKRNVEIITYLSNFNLQYNKTDDKSVLFDDVEISDLYKRDYLFVVASLTRNFNSSFSKDKISYSPLKWHIEIEITKNQAGKWVPTISSFTNSSEVNLASLESFKVDVIKSFSPVISLASELEKVDDKQSSEVVIPEAAYDEEYYSLISAGEKAFLEERYDDAYETFDNAKKIKNYDSYVNVMLSRSKRLNEVQLLNSSDMLISLYSRQALEAEKRGEIEIALKRYTILSRLKNDKIVKEKLNLMDRRVRAKDDVTFALSLNTKQNQIKDLEKKAKGKNKNIEYDLGKALLMQKIYAGQPKELKQALSPLDAILKKEPDFIRARLARTSVNKSLGDFKSAIKDLDHLILKNPKDYPFYIERGRIYLAMNLVDNAIQDFAKANEINPIAPAGHFELGKIYLSKNNYTEAEYHFKQCIAAQYSDPTFHYYYSLAIKDADLIKSLQHLKIARELDSKQNLEVQIEKELSDCGLKIDTYIKQGELDYADQIVNKALDVNSNSVSILISKSILLKTRKTYSEAIPILERLLTMSPKSPKIKYELADNYAKAGRFDQSLNLFNIIISELLESKKKYLRGTNSNSNVALAYDKEILKNYVGLADLYFNNKRYNEAIESYTKAKDIKGLNEEYFIVRLAESYFNTASIKEAQSTISYGLKLNPQNFEYYYLRGLIFLSEEDYKNAIINFTKASSDINFRDNSYYQLALISYKNLNYEQTLKHLKQVSSMSEFWENSLEYASLISLKINNKNEEEKYFNELEKFYSNPESNKNKYTSIIILRDVIRNKDLDISESSALELLKDEPNNARLLYSLALVNLKKGKEDLGYNYLERCLRTEQLFQADLYLDPEFEKLENRKLKKLIKDNLK